MASQIIEIISGESVTIGDIVNNDGSTEGVPFDDSFYCHAIAVSSKNKCMAGLILATREETTDPFHIILTPEITKDWDGKITLIITVENAEPYTNSNGVLVRGEGATIVGKEKVYIKAEKFC